MPAFFLYPQYAQSDVVPSFHEDTRFGDLLDTMFPPNAPPPDWDSKHEYVIGRLTVYAITHLKRLLKVGMKMTLRNVCETAKSTKEGRSDGLEVRDGYLSFVVVPRGEPEQRWIEEFKSMRDQNNI